MILRNISFIGNRMKQVLWRFLFASFIYFDNKTQCLELLKFIFYNLKKVHIINFNLFKFQFKLDYGVFNKY